MLVRLVLGRAAKAMGTVAVRTRAQGVDAWSVDVAAKFDSK